MIAGFVVIRELATGDDQLYGPAADELMQVKDRVQKARVECTFTGQAAKAEKRNCVSYVIPRISGNAYITGYHQFVLNPKPDSEWLQNRAGIALPIYLNRWRQHIVDQMTKTDFRHEIKAYSDDSGR